MSLIQPREVDMTSPLRVYKLLRRDLTSVPRGYQYKIGKREGVVPLKVEHFTHPTQGEMPVIYEGYHSYASVESIEKDYEDDVEGIKSLGYIIGEFEIPVGSKAYYHNGKLVSESIKLIKII